MIFEWASMISSYIQRMIELSPTIAVIRIYEEYDLLKLKNLRFYLLIFFLFEKHFLSRHVQRVEKHPHHHPLFSI